MMYSVSVFVLGTTCAKTECFLILYSLMWNQTCENLPKIALSDIST